MAAKKKADAAVENTAEVTQETVQEEIEQVTEENAKELDNKKYVVDHLLSSIEKTLYLQQLLEPLTTVTNGYHKEGERSDL